MNQHLSHKENIFRYLRNLLSNRERYSVEKEMNNDPFLSDALDGFDKISTDDLESDLNFLNVELDNKINGKKRFVLTPFIKIAAGIALVIGITTLIMYQVNSNASNNEFAESNQKKDSTNTNTENRPSLITINDDASTQNQGQVKLNDVITQNPNQKKDQQNLSDTEIKINLDETKKNGFIAKGIILDGSEKKPLIGATIREKGTTNSATTNKNGEFSILVASNSSELEISYSGYKPQIVLANKTKSISVLLTEKIYAQKDDAKVEHKEQKTEDVPSIITGLKDDGSKDISNQDNVQIIQNNKQEDAMDKEIPHILNCRVAITYNTYNKQHAEPKGGKDGLESFINKNNNIASKTPTTIELSMTINTDGSLANINFLGNDDPKIDLEIQKLLEQYGKWKPALIDGKAIEENVIIRIAFDK